MDDLDRMFRRLVQNVRAGYPEYLSRPFEVSELYQNLIPYRHNRRELGIETNQDYELTLLRLLSGARGYVYGDESMQEFLRQELASPNPDTSAFRAYSGAMVTIAPEALRRPDHAPAVAGSIAPVRHATETPDDSANDAPDVSPYAPTPASTVVPTIPRQAPAPRPAPTPRSVQTPRPAPMPTPQQEAVSFALPPAATTRPAAVTQVAPPPQPTLPPPTPTPTPGAPMANPQRLAGGSCRYGAGALPEGRRIVFCPHCGQNLTIQHCPACSTELEMGWKFCTTCGRAVGS